ncbi:hypothetical protein BX616_008964 [Lobosporangium transversale]|uniref:UBX domain-containing protein n=1 Tax=Lobosporangium transversale TaxID=64571 RepID=A0A1Y2GV33_9FUNG|nr:hypothetical protein BCR41DRAFT_349840 [Lobosporangium transversale]KAF9918404.1 hypothetical protein BX616_008964 [Lobosporangium transversale]ORZ22885.1 hypothetical protein BCR41DRAFT_349840 [Lobosporangium transversale]|eukprot:XP_021883439.1 hypothetical protein BCR41DRAFT_349840 [Lobosporangium transversale]
MGDTNHEDIVQFCTITSADPDVASNYLTVCEGSLERAITLYMESGGVDLAGTTPVTNNNSGDNASTRRSRNSSNSGSPGGYLDQDEELARSLQEEDTKAASTIRAPIAPRHEMLISDDYGDRSSPLYGGSSRSRPAPSVFLPPDSSSLARDAFRDFAAEAATLGGETSPKTSRLADLFKAPLDIMARGNFDQSRNVAKKEMKWLMVNIQEAGVFACQVLNRDLWSDPSVKEHVKENFIFLQFYSDSVEGKKYAAYYPLQTFPHIAIIDPRTAERMHVWSKTIDPVDFLSDVSEFLEVHSLTDSTSKPSQPKKKKTVKDVSDMTEEEQLHAALVASMGGDTSNAVDLGDDEVNTPISDSFEEATPVEPEVSVFDSIKPVRHEEPTDPATSTRIGFRLSDGSRLMRRFPKDAPVRALFEFVKAEVEDARTQSFELVFIGKQLLDDVDKTLAEVGVENAQIMVQM